MTSPTESPEAQAPSLARAWLLSVRPKTLLVAVGPVAVGTAVAVSRESANFAAAAAALLGALLLQVGCNFANDVYDSEKGADNDDRLGPPRAVQLGLLSPSQMKKGMAVAFALAAAVGVYLAGVAGWPIIAVGLVSILAAYAYTGGPYPLGYHGLGDVAVFLFFGVVAVVCTEFVQSLAFSTRALGASVPVGMLATSVLVVNNLRDVDTDRAAGKRTLAVRIGVDGTRAEYALLVWMPFALLPTYIWLADRSAWVLLPGLTLPLALRLVSAVRRGAVGAELNVLLGETARLSLLFSVLFAIGYAL
ncbi:MAG: 1,4-dihydroxy-2-naphthoate polyprenyltransferase [Myxococcota bacterium]|nr:1,4-dihydroxy-2-naphthoate polyprenyltransferase [Myxococcota bacterium]